MPQTEHEREYMRAYRQKKAAEIRASRRAYRQQHAAEIQSYMLAYREKNKARLQETDQAYKQANQEKIRAKKKAYAQRNAVQISERKRAYRLANAEKRRLSWQVYAAKHAQRLQEVRRAYRETHQEQLKEALRLWGQRNRPRNAANQAKRRARQAAVAINDLTPAQWEAIKSHYGYCCVYCGRKMEGLTQDHITPFAKKGNNTFSNVVPACKSCNSRKKDGPPLVPVQPLLLLAP